MKEKSTGAATEVIAEETTVGQAGGSVGQTGESMLEWISLG